MTAFDVLDDEDLPALNDVKKHVIDVGGQVWLAYSDSDSDNAIGCVGCKPTNEPGVVEICKLAVRATGQRQGTGKLLMQTAIDHCRKQLHAKRIILETNSKLTAALALYRKLGFNQVREDQWQPIYPSADVCFELML